MMDLDNLMCMFILILLRICMLILIILHICMFV